MLADLNSTGSAVGEIISRRKLLQVVGFICGTLCIILYFARPHIIPRAVAAPPAAMDGKYEFSIYEPVTHTTVEKMTWIFTTQCSSSDSCTAHIEDTADPNRVLPKALLDKQNWRVEGLQLPNNCGTQSLSWNLIEETSDFTGRVDRHLNAACTSDGKTNHVYGVTVEKMKPGMNGKYTVAVNDPAAISHGTRFWYFSSTCSSESSCVAHVNPAVDPHLGFPDMPDAQLADGHWTITNAPLPRNCGTDDFTWDATTLTGTVTQHVTEGCGPSGTYPIVVTRNDQFH